jgi:hypothetical protein
MKKVILVSIVILAGVFSFAKDGDTSAEATKNSTCVVKGQITDKINGESLTGVAVRIAESNMVAYTDFDGEFTFGDLAPGTYTIEASMVSYQEEKIQITAMASFVDEVDIELEIISEK